MKTRHAAVSLRKHRRGRILAFTAFVLVAGFAFPSSALSPLANSNLQPGKAEVAATVESRTLSVRINRPFQVVYGFLAIPENWNSWAAGLGKSITRTGDGWVADSSNGLLQVRFTPKNSFGVVDHYVKRSSGAEIYVPMRVIANGVGSELLFTLFREPGVSDERFNVDLEFVKNDLNALKAVLEK